MARGQGRSASELLYGRFPRGSGPVISDNPKQQDREKFIDSDSWPRLYNNVESLNDYFDPFEDYGDYGMLAYVCEPIVSSHGSVIYDAIYLTAHGWQIVVGSDNGGPELSHRYQSLSRACDRLSSLRSNCDPDDYDLPEQLNIDLDQVLDHINRHVVWRS